MDVLIKILLSTTLVYAIHFVYKTFTSNNFDKLFMPKYQKSLHNTFMNIFIFIIFIIYGVFFAAMYGKIQGATFINLVITILFIIYFIGLTTTGLFCLYKRINDRKASKAFVLKEKQANALLFLVFFLNILVFSITLYEVYIINETSVIVKSLWLGNLVNCIIFFYALSYFLLKSNIYLQGINKREWGYVLSPTPEGIEEKHLYVLYSLNSTTLVLSDDPDNKHYPKSVYLFDLTKKSYTCFNRVLNLNKTTTK
ncbi:hypothetical protein PN4B1_49040 [Paenibacillus naphthalenovorans]|uniref:hypothetical protein n=1 Tax=Paenibacillus naphthalenovorans TaxID=162209 RepID=UPI0010B0A6FA|nr:hypothetical protein [Paenibacillus naphthalenovorans]GCL74918.1 hypothetical protein PN4B1_49040 [Paenibacillus naphthalenovorans]